MAYMNTGNFTAALKDLEVLIELTPDDKVAKKKLEECEKEVRSSAFRNAIFKEKTEKAEKLKRESAAEKPFVSIINPWTRTGVPSLMDLTAEVIGILRLNCNELLQFLATEVASHISEYIESLQHSKLFNYTSNSISTY
jgi:hypothetical protein